MCGHVGFGRFHIIPGCSQPASRRRHASLAHFHLALSHFQHGNAPFLHGFESFRCRVIRRRLISARRRWPGPGFAQEVAELPPLPPSAALPSARWRISSHFAGAFSPSVRGSRERSERGGRLRRLFAQSPRPLRHMACDICVVSLTNSQHCRNFTPELGVALSVPDPGVRIRLSGDSAYDTAAARKSKNN